MPTNQYDIIKKVVDEALVHVLHEDCGGATTTFFVGGEGGFAYDKNALPQTKDPAYVHRKKGGIACDRIDSGKTTVEESTIPLKDVVDKYYQDADEQGIIAALDLDPTSPTGAQFKRTPDGEMVLDIEASKKGRFFAWIMKNYEIYCDDMMWWEDDLKDALSKFVKACQVNYNGIDRDINKYSIPGLIDTMFAIDPSDLQTKSERCEQFKTLYEDDEWVIYKPLTHDAARFLGHGSRWCTSAGDNGIHKGTESFNAYAEQGGIYINMDKRTDALYQFNFTFGEYRDSENTEIIPNERDFTKIAQKIGMPEGAFQWYMNNITELQSSK